VNDRKALGQLGTFPQTNNPNQRIIAVINDAGVERIPT
jgi:hypothetical protein